MNITQVPVYVWLIATFGILFIIYFAAMKIIEMGFSFKDFIFKGTNKKENCPESHMECSRHNDIMIVIDKSYEVSNYEISLMKMETIREQMDYADHVMSNLLNNLQTYYVRELKNYIDDATVTRSDDFLDYEKTLDLFKRRLMSSFREFCRQNHFIDKDEEEFDKYRQTKAVSLLNEGSKYLNDLYMYQKHITREMLFKINEPHIPEFLATIKDIITNARQVAIKNNAKLKEKKWELATLLESFVGANNAILDTWKKQHGLI